MNYRIANVLVKDYATRRWRDLTRADKCHYILDLINSFPDATGCDGMEDGFGVHHESNEGVHDDYNEGVRDDFNEGVHDEIDEGDSTSSDDRDQDTRSGGATRSKKAENRPVPDDEAEAYVEIEDIFGPLEAVEVLI